MLVRLFVTVGFLIILVSGISENNSNKIGIWFYYESTGNFISEDMILGKWNRSRIEDGVIKFFLIDSMGTSNVVIKKGKSILHCSFLASKRIDSFGYFTLSDSLEIESTFYKKYWVPYKHGIWNYYSGNKLEKTEVWKVDSLLDCKIW